MGRQYAGLGACLIVVVAACSYSVRRKPDILVTKGPWAVVPFFERPYLGMAQPLAQHLALQLAAEGVDLAPITATGSAKLLGNLRVETRPSATRAGIGAYALFATIEVRLCDAQGQTLWQKTLSLVDDFLPDMTPDVQPLLTEANRQLAVARLAHKAAQDVVTALLEDLDGT